ncbi:MAG: glycosyltransferase [Candidatus Caenarcaniphilales bacterium]|nr:glycosyltransferase [Candidatus Caenarcaniphilales bacterium]
MKFTIITPCFQAEKYIQETALSILRQRAVLSGEIELEYLVQDGGSSDRTISLLEELKNPSIKIESSKDQGMYDALARGFKKASGGVIAYLNAGDLYTPFAFEVVRDIFSLKRSKQIQWLSGLQVAYNEASQFVASQMPCRYRRDLFQKGVYDGVMHPFLQQEVTFWKSDLLTCLDLIRLSEFKLAGDYYLWQCFAQVAELTLCEAHLGGFKIHAGQLSGAADKYLAELRSISLKPSLIDMICVSLDRSAIYLPSKLKKKLSPEHYLRYDHKLQIWQ